MSKISALKNIVKRLSGSRKVNEIAKKLKKEREAKGLPFDPDETAIVEGDKVIRGAGRIDRELSDTDSPITDEMLKKLDPEYKYAQDLENPPEIDYEEAFKRERLNRRNQIERQKRIEQGRLGEEDTLEILEPNNFQKLKDILKKNKN